MTHELIERAAAERAKAVQQRSNRPQERRAGEEPGAMTKRTAGIKSSISIRAAATGGPLDFDGYASVYDAPYEMYDFFGPYQEIVEAGAGADSLNRADLDVPFVLNHDSLRRIARTTNGSLQLSEDDNGLHVLAPGLDPEDGDVAYIAPKLRSGLVDEMSFKFRITQGLWSPDYTQYSIKQYDIHRGDVAIVGYGASPHTAGSGLRSADPDLATARALIELALAEG